MRKFFLLMVAAVCSLTMSAKSIYLSSAGVNPADLVDPEVYIWSWGETTGVATHMMKVGEDLYAGVIADGETDLLFAFLPVGMTEFDWNLAEGQTTDQVIDVDHTLFAMTDKLDGYWTSYASSFVPDPSMRTVYLNTGGTNLWSKSNSFFVWSWSGTGVATKMQHVEGYTFGANFPVENDALLFVRMPFDITEATFDWIKKVDQTYDLYYQDSPDFVYTITELYLDDSFDPDEWRAIGEWSSLGLGDVKVRFYVSDYSGIDMSGGAEISMQFTNNNTTKELAVREGTTNWWSATLHVDDESYNYVHLWAFGDGSTQYASYMFFSNCTDKELCFDSGPYKYSDEYGSDVTHVYEAQLVACDYEEPDYSIASATLTGGAGFFTYDISLNDEQANKYSIDLYTGSGEHYGAVDAYDVSGKIYLSSLTSPITFTSWSITPVNAKDHIIGPSYSSTASFTVEPDPDQSCTYTLKMFDTYGDGWNGCYLTVADNGHEQSFSLSSGSEETLAVIAYGGTPTIEWHKGSYESEVGYTFYDVNGLVLFTHEPGTTMPLTVEMEDPCETRFAPDNVASVNVTDQGDNKYQFSWDPVTGIDAYYVRIYAPNGKIVALFAVQGTKFNFDFNEQLLTGDYTVEVIPAHEDGTPYYESGATAVANVFLENIGEMTVRYYIPDYIDIPLNNPMELYIEDGEGNSYSTPMAREGESRWIVGTFDFPAPSYQYMFLNTYNDEETIIYRANRWIESKQKEVCVKVEGFNYEDDYGSYVVRWYYSSLLDCDEAIKDYSVESATITGGVGKFSYEIVPKEELPAYYIFYFYTGAGDYYSSFSTNELSGTIWMNTLETSVTFTSWIIIPCDAYGAQLAPEYESTEAFTVEPNPDRIQNLEVNAVGGNKYAISWDYNANVPYYRVYLSDQGGTVINQAFAASELTVDGGKFVVTTPAMGVEGMAYACVQVVYENDELGAWAEKNFYVENLDIVTNATIRVLIPTDNNMDISKGVWFWWWPAGTTDGQLAEATPVGGRWYEANINPNATGFQFLVVNQDVSGADGWNGCQQSFDSPIIGGDGSCFELTSKIDWNEKWPLKLVDCAAEDHDYRATSLTFDNSVPGFVTGTLIANNYAPNYEIGYRVLGSTGSFMYEEFELSATDNTFTLDIPVIADTEYEYKFYIDDADWWLVCDPMTGTFTVKFDPEQQLGNVDLNVLIPTDNNMDITNGVWIDWWIPGKADHYIAETTKSGRWFSANFTVAGDRYQFRVVNQDVSVDGWGGAEASEESTVVTDDEFCVELGYRDMEDTSVEDWHLIYGRGCGAPDHDYRATFSVDNSTPGRLVITVDANDYAAFYQIGYRLEGTTDDYYYYYWEYSGSNEFILTLSNPADISFEYILEVYDDKINLVTAREHGTVTIKANPAIPMNLDADVEGQDVLCTWTVNDDSSIAYYIVRLWGDFGTEYTSDELYTMAGNFYFYIPGNYEWRVGAYDSNDILVRI